MKKSRWHSFCSVDERQNDKHANKEDSKAVKKCWQHAVFHDNEKWSAEDELHLKSVNSIDQCDENSKKN